MMKVPLSWLKDFVDITLSAEELAHVITMSGLEVGEVQYIGVEGSALPWEPDLVMVANVREVKPHPNADRLVLADVDYGGPQPHTVVTGAPNLFPYKGQGPLPHPLKAVFAREGARLYDGHKEGWEIVTLKGRPVRGVMSDAMLCSEKELGISDEHEGIIFLEDDAPIGAPLRDVLGEVVFDIDLTPNVARALSIIGVAREVAALTGAPLRIPAPQVTMEGPPIEGRAHVTVEDARLCPRFTLSLIEGLTVGQSPPWMQRRLRHAGMRPINVIVDISNYVMLEWGEPTHAFDADKVQDQHLVARLARSGERLVTLDDKERDLTPYTGDVAGPLLVCDPSGPLGIAGVMGGAESEVRDDTSRILLEAAIWEPVQIRRTARTYKLPSEASRRFERGVDVEVVHKAQHRALELMRTLAGGTVAQGIIDVYPEPERPRLLELPPSEVRRLLGISLSAEQIAEMLSALGFACQVRGVSGIGDLAGVVGTVMDPMTVLVSVPSFRQDVTSLADLCEEVARMYGYDNIPYTYFADEIPTPDPHPDLEREQRVRDTLVGCGLDEAITYSLTSMEAVARLIPAEADAGRYLRLSNAITPEREYLRRSLLPTLLEALALSLREREQVQFFEVGRVYLPRSAPDEQGSWLPDEPRRLALALGGPRSALHWEGSAREPLDFFDLKGIVEVLLERFGLSEQAHFEPLTNDERLHPGRAARVLLAPGGSNGATPPEQMRELGVFGELHPAVRERYDIQVPRVAIAEFELDVLIELTRPSHYATISRYPASVQDLAVVVSDEVSAAQVADLIRRGAGSLLESLELFDVYTGAQVGEGQRSLAYRLTFRAPDRTLTDEALSKVRGKVVRLLEREAGATLRG
jgi:phenylalanyl-tRNA synthetase beta chain